MAPTTPNYRMADRLAGGQLEAELTRLRSADVSFAGIAAQLYADHGIEVTAPTVRQWCITLGITATAEVAS